MGKHSGERSVDSSPASSAPAKTVVLLALGLTATLVAWGVLVFAAIDFGSQARSGGAPIGWAFLALSTVGAAACLFVTLLLAARLLTVLQGKDPAPARPGGGHRAP